MPTDPETTDLAPVHRLMTAAGLPERANMTYLALVERPRLRATEIAELLALDVLQVQDDLAEMRRIPLVKEPVEPGVFVAVPPDHAVELLIARVEKRIAREQADMERARARVPQLVETFVQPRVEKGHAQIEYVEEPSAVRARLFQISLKAAESACSMNPGEPLSPDNTQASLRLDLDLLRRGVSLRSITSTQSLSAAHWLDHLRVISREGAAVRVMDAPPLLQILIDRRIVVVPRRDGPGACIMRGLDLCAPAVGLFEAAWATATPLGEALGEPTEGALSAKHRRLFALLAEGLTDEAAARRMGCSLRTVGRLIAELMRELQASSRLQAGVIGERRGLLSR